MNLKQVFAFLGRDEGYHKSVFLDEAHAYLLGDLDWLEAQGVNTKPLRGAAKKLRKLFETYAP